MTRSSVSARASNCASRGSWFAISIKSATAWIVRFSPADPDKVLNNGCDLVVELVGGIEPARGFIERSLARGKHVVTANKALLALDGFSLMKAAEQQKVRLGFEASVCGGIPIIRALRDGLVGNNIQRLSGILNGTCNYILTRMTEDGVEFAGCASRGAG